MNQKFSGRGNALVGVGETVAGALFAVTSGGSAKENYAVAAREFGASGALDWSTAFQLSRHELMQIWSYTGLAPTSWWHTTGSEYLAQANGNVVAMLAFAAFAVYGINDFRQGIKDIGGNN